MNTLAEACARLERAKAEYADAMDAVRTLLNGELRAFCAVPERKPMRPDGGEIDCIVKTVAEHHGVEVAGLMGRGRTAPYVISRQRAEVIIRRMLHLSSTDVGRVFNRDHCAILWAEKQVASHCETEPAYRQDFDLLMLKCQRAVMLLRSSVGEDAREDAA